jgi:hypothetical protein
MPNGGSASGMTSILRPGASSQRLRRQSARIAETSSAASLSALRTAWLGHEALTELQVGLEKALLELSETKADLALRPSSVIAQSLDW